MVRAALGGTMVPLGEAKGTALALMVELLAAGLTGSNYAAEASSFLDAEGPRQRPHPGREDGGADQAGQGEQPGDVRELVPQRQGAGGGQAHRDRHGEDGAENGQPSRTHNALSHGRGP